jgi:hypothetical protein
MDGQTDGLEEKAKKRLTKRLTDEHRRERKGKKALGGA